MSSLVIQTFNGEVFSLDDAKPGDSLASVKARIQDRMGIPINRQELSVNDNLLADTYKLPAAAAKLDLQVWIDIEIRKLDGESFTVQVEAHDYVWDAKSKIGAKDAIGPERQHLILDQTNIPLGNSMRLSQCNVHHKSILSLIIEPPSEWWQSFLSSSLLQAMAEYA
jgi:hypothetical protein